MGIARLVLVGLAVLVVVALIVLGVLSLIGSLGSGAETTPSPVPSATTSSAAASPASSTSERVPTVLVECLREQCPTVFLKVTGGDVLFDREMARGEQFRSFDPKVDVVLADSAAVRVQVNGAVRSPGKAGERQEFTVPRKD
ncbi:MULTISPECIES: hypothetical protein [unclassified Streptosporangium]|uniref:hypothetical protein n=1 Tax=unclassified Streptosporangium TaxID=2632669 RepID=UPI002E2ABD3B|nr:MULTISPECIES: hypothetical protein [unclassified Streptosporangium]